MLATRRFIGTPSWALQFQTTVPLWVRQAQTAAPAVKDATRRTVTMVKKLTPDGTACRKCLDIEARLHKDGLAKAIDRVIYMDPSAPGVDEGTKLAIKHDVKVAPFFVVSTEDGNTNTEDVYTVYMKMKRQVFNKKASMSEANTDVALDIF